MKPTLLVLAAGMGSRYGGLKQMDPMGPHGETLLDYSVFDAARAGFGRVVFVIRRDFETLFREQVGVRFAGHIEVDYAFQDIAALPPGFTVPEGRTKPWGTGHAILCAREAIHEPFCSINADDFYGRSAYAEMGAWLTSLPDDDKVRGAMAGYRLGPTLSEHGSVARGICRADASGNLLAVEEMTKIFKTGTGAENRLEGNTPASLTGNEPVSMNFWGFSKNLFPSLDNLFREFLHEEGTAATSEFYIPKAVDQLISRNLGVMRLLPTDSPWFGVTYREDKPNVQSALGKLIAAGEYPAQLWKS